MAALLITFLLAVGAVAFVAWPFMGRDAVPAEDDPPVDVLRERQQAAVEALRELDYERQIGKMTDAEYFPLRERYARQAMALLKRLDQRDTARENALERAISARRSATAAGTAVPTLAARAGVQRAAGPGRTRSPWLVGTGAGILALVVAIGLLVSMIRQGGRQAVAVGQVPLQAPRALALLPDGSGRLLAAGANGLRASSDGGKTWQAQPSSVPASTIVSLFPAPDGRALQAIVQGKGLMQSTDGGRDWSAVADAPILPQAAQALAEVPGTPALIVAATQSGMEASTDNGRTWAVANGFVNGLLPTKVDRDVVYAPTADQSTGPQGVTFHGLLFVATNNGLYASADGGQSWLARTLGGDLAALAVDPRNPSALLAMDVNGELFRSEDAGATWSR